ncbi:MAG: HEAT repeat domain-containing protein, partial [Isosphaeraceae bacterium]
PARGAMMATTHLIRVQSVALHRLLVVTRPRWDSEAAEAYARALGCYGAAAKEAVPCLIGVLRNRVQENERWTDRVAAALALGQIGPDAKSAIPALREAVHSRIPEMPESAVIALVRVAPDGGEIARKWLESSKNIRSRARVLGALGESSFEGDYQTANYMKIIAQWLDSPENRDTDSIYLEDWFLELGRLGWGAHKAIPWLRRALDHPNPWVRLWAREALARISRQRKLARD